MSFWRQKRISLQSKTTVVGKAVQLNSSPFYVSVNVMGFCSLLIWLNFVRQMLSFGETPYITKESCALN